MAYTPSIPADCPPWLRVELQKISEASTVPFVMLEPQAVAPKKPRKGMVAYADGVNWNPGLFGEGVYRFDGSTWNRLG